MEGNNTVNIVTKLLKDLTDTSSWGSLSFGERLLVALTLILIAVGVIQILIMLITYFRPPNPKEKTLPKPSILPFFEVKNIDQLEEVASTIPFMENPVVGKFVDITERRTWSRVKNEVDFSKQQPLDLSSPHKIFVIKGKPGIGKSTYMLWSLDESLRNKSWIFNKIIFLNPDSNAYYMWAEMLSKYDPKQNLLVIDALKRGADTDEVFKERCFHLFKLATGEEQIGEKTIGPFKVLTTLRDDEYTDLVKQKKFESVSSITFPYEITPEKLDLEKILKNYLRFYNVSNKVPASKENAIFEQVRSKSAGLPFYIRQLVADLHTKKKDFSEKTLKEYPTGMVNLIWQTIKKGYYLEDDNVIPFLLLLLLHTNKYFSTHYFNFAVEKLSQKELRKNVRIKIENLKSFYFQSSFDITELKDSECFTLDSHWKSSLKDGLDQPEIVEDQCRHIANSYIRIEKEKFQRLKEEIATGLENHLQGGFKDKADIFMCIDLAKMGEEYLENATEIYCNTSQSSKLAKDYIDHAREELYGLWISTAWKYRAVHNDEKVGDRVILCYTNAFDKLGVRTEFKQLSAYAYYLQTRILPKFKHGTQEFQDWIEKIENLHKEVIDLQLAQGIKDPISHQTLALFYNSIGEHKKAEDSFEKSIQIDSSRIHTLQSYAIFLKDMGNIEWYRDRIKALEYYKKAQHLFETGRSLLRVKEKGKLSKEDKQNEKELLNAYAIFLMDQAGWQATIDEKRKYDEMADSLFLEVLNKYPDHKESINKYADFLMKYGWILPKYKHGKNLEEAEKRLNSHIDNSKKKNKPPDPVALNTLAILLYKFKPQFKRSTPDFENASRHLRESAEFTKNFNPKQSSIAYHELGRVYMKWAKFLEDDQNEYNIKMDLAEKALQKAVELPESPMNFMHLSKVYLTYSFYSTYKRQKEQAKVYRNKAFELVKQNQMVPLYYYFLFNKMGDDLIEEEPEEAIEFYAKAKEAGIELSLKNSYPYFKLGECYKGIGDIENALENYLKSAKIENSFKRYGAIRNLIKQIMQDYDIRKSAQPIYERCLQARRECSKKAYELNPDFWKNCGDYGEDLLELREYERAIPVFEKGINLILKSEELDEVNKNKSLSWFYEKIGFSYKDNGNIPRAEEFLNKSVEIDNSAIGYFRMSGWMFELEKYKETIIAFEKIAEKFTFSEKDKEEIFPFLDEVLEKIAISYEKLQEEDVASIFWKYYADISFYSRSQKSSSVCGIVGNKFLKMNIFHEARECFLKAIRSDLGSIKNFSQLGYVDYKLQRWEECMICSDHAFNSDRKDSRDKRQYIACQQKHERNLRIYDFEKIEDLLDIAIIEELRGENEKALKYYSDALAKLDKHEFQNEASTSIYEFIGDSFWALGKKNDALNVYKKVKEKAIGYEKIIAEAIYWFMYAQIHVKNTVNGQGTLL
jgi:tetratricopeptide (TPR) repeat protein